MMKAYRWGIAVAAVTFVVASCATAEAEARPEPAQDLYGILAALLQYTFDSGHALPPMQDVEVAKKALWPYSHDDACFINSQTGEKYQPNAFVTQRKLASLEGKKVVLFYEPTASVGGKRWALFLPEADINGDFDLHGKLDRYIRQVSPADWEKLRLDPGD